MSIISSKSVPIYKILENNYLIELVIPFLYIKQAQVCPQSRLMEGEGT